MKRLSLLLLLAIIACRPSSSVTSLEPPVTRGADAADPALAIDPESGDLLLTWTEGDSSGYAIRFARSSDRGETWSAPETVAGPAADIKPHAESAPRLLAMPHRTLAVAWANSVPAPGQRWPASNMRFARSTDGGRTWSSALTLNDDSATTTGGHLFHGVAWEGDSGIVVAWMDGRTPPCRGGDPCGRPAEAGNNVEMSHDHAAADAEPDARVYVARSHDNGATWERANTPMWGSACPCCRIALARAPTGAVQASWRNHYPGNVRDIVVASLSDSMPTRVHVDGWEYPGCPHAGPGLAVDDTGASHVAWFTGKEGAAGIFYARRDANGSIGAPLPLVTARTLPASHTAVVPRRAGGAWVAYDIDARGRSLPTLAQVGADGQLVRVHTLGVEGADHLQLAELRNGQVVAAWAQRGGKSAVRVVRVE